ncbi:unnamed protein product [Arabis nemorensis]|uniref:Uncharacterized protein n=1 Tax=Arabis nemorensis TaxID=586526 RepID=A0A565CVK1_9BRAS|nr:unnamed protein product [Arabis nemorensis]
MEKSTEKSVTSVASGNSIFNSFSPIVNFPVSFRKFSVPILNLVRKYLKTGNSINSKLRYPLRSALRSKEGKPPVPDFSGSSAPRRGRAASAVSQSTTVLDLSAKKSVDRTKPPRRLSIPNKATSSSSVKSVSSSITSVSESKVRRPVSSAPRSVTRRKVEEDLSSSTYWLSHIKLAESVAKHSISLGFFKLALHAGCEPIDQMKEELKSYARRNNLDGLADAMKELSELYNISEESKQMEISETGSVVAEETTASLNNDNDVLSSFSTPGDSNITSETTKDDALQDSAVIETSKEEEPSETNPQGRTKRSLDEINVNQEVVQESEEEETSETNPQGRTKRSLDEINVNQEVVHKSEEEETSETNPQGRTRRSLDVINVNQEAVQESEDGVPNVTVVQPSDKKRANKKETVSKNSQPVRTKKSLANNSAKTRTVPEKKSLKKDEKITKPRTKKIQEGTKKTTKKSAAAKEAEVKSLKQMENKENSTNASFFVAGCCRCRRSQA